MRVVDDVTFLHQKQRIKQQIEEKEVESESSSDH